MKKLTFTLSIISAVLFGFVYDHTHAGTDENNYSGIEVSWFDLPRRQICRGIISDNANLNEIGISNEDIKKGINCVAGDFDGNGYLDFLIFGKYVDKPPVIAHPEKYLAIFYQKQKIISQITIEHRRLSHPLLYQARDYQGEFGEPASKTDGFYEPGEGGTTVVFIYNKKSKNFESSEHASEYH